MLGIIVGVLVALLWGGSTCLGNLATRRLGPTTTTFVAQTSGLLALALLGESAAPLLNLLSLTPTTLVLSLLLGVLIGAVGTLAYAALYRSLHLGPLAVVSPLVNGSVTLLLSIFVLGDRPPLERLLVLVVILFGVGLASLQLQDLSRFFHQPGVRVLHGTGIRWALIAMLGLGVLNFGMGTAATRTSAWFLVLFWTRLFSLFFLLLSQLLPPRTPEPPLLLKRSPRAAWPLAVAAGLTELAGLVLFSLDAQLSSTSVAAVLASANSLLPIFVGIAVFHERLTRSQGTGVAFVVLGVIELGAPGPVRDPLLFLTLAGAVAIVCLLLLPRETCKGASQSQTPAPHTSAEARREPKATPSHSS